MSASVTLEKTSFQQFTILVNGEVYRQIHTTIFGKSPKLPSYIDEKQWEEDFFLYELKLKKTMKRFYSYPNVTLQKSCQILVVAVQLLY